MRNFFVLLLAAALISSCESESVKMEKEITKLEAVDSNTSPEYLQKLQDNYIAYSEKYPENKKSAGYLFKAAEKAGYLGNEHLCFTLLDTLMQRYPDTEAAKLGLIKKAIMYEDKKQCDKARDAYGEFLARYPKDPLRKDVELSLKSVCKGEEIFEQKIVEDPDEEPPVK